MIIWIGAGIIGLIILISIWRKMRRKKEKEREMAQSAQDKLREKALDDRILNKAGIEPGAESPATPIEVNYDSAQIEHTNQGHSASNADIMLQIVENNDLSSKKYILDPSKCIKIGNKVGANNIVVDTGSKSEEQCEIVYNSGAIYIRNIKGSNNISLVRKKRKILIEKQYIEMKSGDGIIFGSTLFRVEFIKMKIK